MSEVLASMKDQITRAACQLFRERGFHATSVRDIAEHVGIQGGSLYAHMDKKDDLLWEIVDNAANRFFTALEPIVGADLDIMQKLRRALLAHVAVITADLDAAAVYSVEWRHLTPQRYEAIKTRRDAYEGLFRSLVDQAIRARRITAPDTSSAALFILSTLNNVFSWYRPDGRLSTDEVGRMLTDYIFDGLRRRTA